MLLRLLTLTVILGLWTGSAQAYTIINEDFEVGSIAALGAKGWDVTAASGNDTDGTKTLQFLACPGGRAGTCIRAQYQGYVCPPGGPACNTSTGAKFDRNFTGVPEIWERYFMYDQRINPALPIQHNGKRHYFNTGISPNLFTGFTVGDGAGTPYDDVFAIQEQATVVHVCPNGSFDVTCNIFGASIPENQWVCIENKFGQTSIQTYRNEQLVGSASGAQVVSPATWNQVEFYRQGGGNLYRWEDDWVIATTRIGCGALPPPPSDKTAPAVPTSVTATSNSPGVATVSWTNGSESDRAGHTIRYCTGAACTPAALIGSASANATAASFSGLTEGTLYRFDVNAYDTASPSNQSAYSSIVEVTITSTPVGAQTLAINSSGKAVLNGTQVFLQGASYMDGGQNGWTSDVDQFAALGYNNLRIFANYSEDTYAGARSVCTADGSLNTTRRDILETFLDYVESKNITITLIIMSELTNNLIPVDANKQTCVTNIVNAYKHHPLIMFDLNNEHMEVANTWINSTAKYATYHALAKAACSTCKFFASATSPFTHPQDTSADIVSSYVDGMLSAGVPILAWHDYRSSNWDTITGARVTTLRNYVTSKGQPSIGIYFSEPCRLNFAASCNLSASAYLAAAVRARDAGAMGWVWHHEHFDTSTQTLFSQLSVTNAAIASGLASALATATDTEPVVLETYDFSTALSTRMSGGIVSADTPVISGGRLRANSTSTESVAVYNGTTATLTSLFTCTTANAGPPPSASWLTLSGNGLKVISNQCGQNTASTLYVNDAAVWNTDYGDDQVVQATLAALPANSVFDYALLSVRVQSTGGGYDNLYELEIDRSAGTWRKRLYKIASGSSTQIGATETSTVTAGDVFKLSAVGSTITASQNGTAIITGSDSTFATGGYLAIGSYRDTTASSTRWTNFSGGTYVASTTIPANHGMTAEVPTATGSNPMYLRLGVRMQNDTNYSGYDCRFNFNPDTVSITRKDSNNPVTLAGPVSATLTAGDVPGCWANGSTIYATLGAAGATTLLSTTDPTYSTGKPYVYLNTAGEPVASLEVDNLTIYEYGAPAPPCSPSMTVTVASATGATVTYDTACPPTQIKVDTEINTETLSLASFISGVYTRAGGWKALENYVCFTALDSQGVVGGEGQCDTVAEFVPVADTTAPVMTFLDPTGELPFGTTTRTASFSTDETATCRWATTNIAYAAMTNFTSNTGLTHSFVATGLTTGTTNFYGQCADLAPTPNETSTALTMPIVVAASTADTVAPPTVADLVATAVSPTQISITHPTVTDATSNPVTYEAWVSLNGTDYVRALSYTGVPAVLNNLGASALHYIKVLGFDAVGNPSAAFSNVATATTPAIPDTTRPSDPVGLTAVPFTTSVALTWTPGTDDRVTPFTIIELCSGSPACTAFQVVKTTTNAFGVVIGADPGEALTPNTIYRFRIKHGDGTNVSLNYSERVNVTTRPSTPNALTQPRAPVAYSQPRLPRN